MKTDLPARYDYLNDLLGRPRVLEEALALYGVKEAPGHADNPEILAWAKEVGFAYSYRHDETAWCGLFAALIVKRAGYTPVTSPLWALNWARFGMPADAASIGDVMVFTRPLPGGGSAGHVGLYVGETADHYHVLGGNTADSVSITPILKTRRVAARRCIWRIGQPSGVTPYRLDGEPGPVLSQS